MGLHCIDNYSATHTHTHTHTHVSHIHTTGKMANDDKSQLEGALNTLLQITEKSCNLRKYLKQDIVESVSTLRNIFTNLKNRGEEQNKEIVRLGVELNKAMEQLRSSRVADIKGHTATSGIGAVVTSVGSPHCHLPPSAGANKLYSETIRSRTDKRFKLLVKSKSNLTTEAIKTVLKTNITPTTMKVGVKSFKSLKDGRVLGNKNLRRSYFAWLLN